MGAFRSRDLHVVGDHTRRRRCVADLGDIIGISEIEVRKGRAGLLPGPGTLPFEPLLLVAVGTGIAPSPGTDPDEWHSRIRLFLRVFGLEAFVGMEMQNLRFRQPEIGLTWVYDVLNRVVASTDALNHNSTSDYGPVRDL